MSTPSEAAAAAREALAAAAAARASTHSASDAEAQFAAERSQRQEFRRLVTVGIQRNNDARTAEQTINTLLKLAENILNNPDEDKYKQFKTTNSTVKRTLVDPKGSLEYAQALGFRADVINFQPLYVFTSTPKRLASLRIGAAVLREVVERNNVNDERSRAARDSEKAAIARQAELVRLAYEDDRKEKQRRDQIERERREAVAKAAREAPIGDTAPFVEGAVYGGPIPQTKTPHGDEEGADDDEDHDEDEDEDEDDMMGGGGQRLGGSVPGGFGSGRMGILPLKGSADIPVPGMDDPVPASKNSEDNSEAGKD